MRGEGAAVMHRRGASSAARPVRYQEHSTSIGLAGWREGGLGHRASSPAVSSSCRVSAGREPSSPAGHGMTTASTSRPSSAAPASPAAPQGPPPAQTAHRSAGPGQRSALRDRCPATPAPRSPGPATQHHGSSSAGNPDALVVIYESRPERSRNPRPPRKRDLTGRQQPCPEHRGEA